MARCTMVYGGTRSYHEGAIRYYRERGVWSEPDTGAGGVDRTSAEAASR